MKDVNSASIIEELHQTEEELHKDERRIKIAFALGMFFVIAIIAASSYFIVQSVTALKSTEPVAAIPPSISLAPTEAQPSLSTPTPTPVINFDTTAESNIKDHYINIGSGTNQSTDWEDVAGALTTTDIAQYSNIKEVHLETNINVPSANGTVSVRLFNKTDNYAVWNSERTVQSQTKGDLLISQNIIYDKGPKLYQIQMRSQLGVIANLIQSRIHIITK